jgi:hypothetical protein
MEAYDQVQEGSLRLKGVTELNVTKQKEQGEAAVPGQANPSQEAFEKMQKQQMERIQKKASKTTSRKGRTSADTWTSSWSEVSCGGSSLPG